MKRIILVGLIPFFLLIACTDENSKKEEPLPTSTVETQPNKPITSNQTEHDKVRTNAEEAFVFLEKAAEITSKLETVWFLSMVFNTSYLNDLDNPEHRYFFEYNSTYEGVMQRNPKLAYIMGRVENASGTLVNGQKDLYDESSRLVYTNTQYFDSELGWFSVSGDYSYGGVMESDEQPYIGQNDLDSSFKTLEHVDAFMQLFMSYPNQLSIYKDSNEDVELDNWIIELNLTNEQYMEYLYMLEYNLFTGNYRDVESEELYFVESEDLRDIYLALTFDPAYNLVQLTVNHTYNGLEDYVDANRNDYFTTIYYAFFSDYNLPYTHSIPEEVILNATYN